MNTSLKNLAGRLIGTVIRKQQKKQKLVMNLKKKNQESTTARPSNHHGSPLARDAVKPAVRLYDMGNHFHLPSEGCEEQPLFKALGAMVATAVAAAAECKPHKETTDRTTVLLISPHETQRQLHEAMVADLQLKVRTSSLQEPSRPQSEIVVLDLITQAWPVGTEDDWRLFRRDPNFLEAAFSAAGRETILLAHHRELLWDLPANAALRRKLGALQQVGTPFKLFPENKFQPAANLDSPGIGFYLDSDEASQQIHKDVAAAKARVIWNLPGPVGSLRTRIQRRPGLEQVLIQPLGPATIRRWEDLGFRVSTNLRGEACILLDDDLIWLLGEERDEEFVYPFARVRGRRTASLVADLFRLREFFTPAAT